MAYLYHYTNNISLIKILVSQTFKFGHLQNTNDPCERLENRFGLSGNYSSIIDKYLDQLCDFYNKKTSIACFGVKNGNISADLKWTMWANYSYKSTGACMVFDKNKFINVIKQEGVMPLEKRIKYNLGSIRFNLTEQIIDLPHKDFLTKYQDKLLFSKHKDWSYEKEFRIVVFEENFKIPKSLYSSDFHSQRFNILYK